MQILRGETRTIKEERMSPRAQIKQTLASTEMVRYSVLHNSQLFLSSGEIVPILRDGRIESSGLRQHE
jgi:hypothetical protein